MGQDDQGAADRKARQGVVDEVLGVVVDRRFRLFDDQDRGIVQVGSRQRDPELLVGLEVMPEGADRRVVSVGKILDEVVGVGQLGRFDDPRQGVHRVAQTDIHQHRVGKDQVGLQDGGDLSTHRFECDVAEVMAVDQDAAGPGIEQSRDQADQGELGIFVLSHDGGAGIGGDLDRNPLEQPAPRAAFELDVFKGDLFLESIQEMSSHVLMKLGPPFQELEDTACRAVGLANRLPQPEPFRDRIGEARQRDEQDQHRRDRDLIVDNDVIAKKPQRDRQRRSVQAVRCSG